MIIGIDGNEANVEKRLGVGEYSFQLLRQLKEFQMSPSTSNIKFQIYLKQKPLVDMPPEDENWRYRILTPRPAWTQIRLPFDLYFHHPKPDVFFTPTHYAPRFCPVPTVISVLDLSYIFFPQLFRKQDLYKLNNWTEYSVKNARKILTISESSRDDIIKYYKVPDTKVKVIYPGLKFQGPNYPSQKSSKMQNSKTVLEKYGVSKKFVLFVGTLQPRKNIERLIEAFAKISSQNSDLQLVIIGKKGWLYEPILEAPRKFGVSSGVTFLDFVPDEDLPSFYEHALCYVLPSLYEGFGLPVLEAMKYGCPVITSNISSLPEAGGDAAEYIDPLSVSDIAEKMQKVIKSDRLRKEMKEKGYNQIKKFSWEKSAKETLKVLEEVAGSR